MSRMKEAALSYAAKGWPVFPVRADKTPYTDNGVLDATTNTKKIKAFWDEYPNANIAMDVGGAEMMALDLDPGHDWDKLEETVGPIPDTALSSSTPRGGRHLFFSLDHGERVAPSASKLSANVDVRSFNSYVLLPPSRTKDGEYEWTGEGKPAYRTDEIVRQANIAKEKAASRDKWIIEPDLEENIALAIKWLKHDAKIATEGVDGDHKAYATAAHMHSFGISRELAADLMWEHWNPRCNPPWSSDEADHFDTKIKNGYHYHTSDPGNITPAYKVAKEQILKDKFKAVVSRDDDGSLTLTGPRFRIVNRKGMNHIRSPEWLIPDFIQSDGFTLMFGARGTMKTFIAIDIAMSVALGIDLDQKRLWWDTADCGPVLFAAGEGRSNFTKRVRLWEKMHNDGDEVDNFYLIDPVPHIETEQVEEFIDYALDALPSGESYKLVVLDTVGRAMQGKNENAQENASMFTNMVSTIQRALGCAVLAIHHTGKQDSQTARGSSVFEADVDTIVRVDRPTKAFNLNLEMTKQKDGPEWTEPVAIKVVEADIGADETSLTVHPMPQEEVKKAGRPPKYDKDRKQRDPQELLIDEQVWRIMHKLFKNYKGKTWTTRALANDLAVIDEMKKMKLGSELLRKEKYLIRYREAEYSKVGHYYDGPTNTWRYAKPPEKE